MEIFLPFGFDKKDDSVSVVTYEMEASGFTHPSRGVVVG